MSRRRFLCELDRHRRLEFSFQISQRRDEMMHGWKLVFNNLSVFENGRLELRRSSHHLFTEKVAGGLPLDSRAGLRVAAVQDPHISAIVPDRADHFLQDE